MAIVTLTEFLAAQKRFWAKRGMEVPPSPPVKVKAEKRVKVKAHTRKWPKHKYNMKKSYEYIRT